MDLLLRKNKGIKSLELFTSSLLQKTSIKDLNFSTLEQRDSLWEIYCKLSKNEKARQIFKLDTQQDNSKLMLIFDHLKTSNQQFNGYVFFNQYSNIGILSMDTPLFFENATTLLNIDGNSIYFLDVDRKNGLLLDYYESDNGLGWTYELIILGYKWSEAFYTLISKIVKESDQRETKTLH